MEWLKKYWEKFKNATTAQKSMIVGGVVILFVFIVWLFNRSSSTEYAQPAASDQTKDNSGSGDSTTINTPTTPTTNDNSDLLALLNDYQNQLTASEQATQNALSQIHSAYTTTVGNVNGTQDMYTFSRLLSAALGGGGGNGGYSTGSFGDVTSNTGAFGLGYDSGNAFAGSLGYSTNSNQARGINGLASMVGLGTVNTIGSLFGFNIGRSLSTVDNMDSANRGLDRTGVFGQNFGGLPAGITEQQAINAFNAAKAFDAFNLGSGFGGGGLGTANGGLGADFGGGGSDSGGVGADGGGGVGGGGESDGGGASDSGGEGW